jgi:hypothetical protein
MRACAALLDEQPCMPHAAGVGCLGMHSATVLLLLFYSVTALPLYCQWTSKQLPFHRLDPDAKPWHKSDVTMRGCVLLPLN